MAVEDEGRVLISKCGKLSEAFVRMDGRYGGIGTGIRQPPHHPTTSGTVFCKTVREQAPVGAVEKAWHRRLMRRDPHIDKTALTISTLHRVVRAFINMAFRRHLTPRQRRLCPEELADLKREIYSKSIRGYLLYQTRTTLQLRISIGVVDFSAQYYRNARPEFPSLPQMSDAAGVAAWTIGVFHGNTGNQAYHRDDHQIIRRKLESCEAFHQQGRQRWRQTVINTEILKAAASAL